MFWAPAGWRCTVLFRAAVAYVKVGGGELYELCRSQAWEIKSNMRPRWNVRPEREKRWRMCCFLSHQPPLSCCRLSKRFCSYSRVCTRFYLNRYFIEFGETKLGVQLCCVSTVLFTCYFYSLSSQISRRWNTHTHTHEHLLVFLKPTNSAAWFRAGCRCVGGPSG